MPQFSLPIAIFATGLSLAAALAPAAARAEPRVLLEVVTAERFPATEIRNWSELLGKMNVGSVPIRGGKAGEFRNVVIERASAHDLHGRLA